jgi:hypothetical protein
MSPQTIPWILCATFCILPIVIGSLTFYLWIQFTNKIPRRDISNYIDDLGREHTVTEWINVTREELRIEKRLARENQEVGEDG